MTDTRDISMFPYLIKLFVIPVLFVISLISNAIVFFVASKVWKLKARISGMGVPLLAHTLIVGVLELSSLNALQLIVPQSWEFYAYAYAGISLYAALSFAEIFLTFRFVTARMMKLKESDASRYALVMGVATNPVTALLILSLLMYLF